MKKDIVLRRIVLTLLISVLLLLTFATIAHRQPNEIITYENVTEPFHAALTHNENSTLTIDAFDITNAIFVRAEGNSSVVLQNGHYPAIYSFENDIAGSEPADWVCTTPGPTNISVCDLISDHRDVVRLWAYQSNAVNMKNAWGYDYENGTVELWIRGTPNNDNTKIELMDGTNQGIYMWFDWGTGELEAYTDTYVFLASITTNKWYHLRIDFSITIWVKNYDVYLNQSEVGTDIAFMTNRTHLDSLRISETGILHTNSISYIDAVDYSWADGYSLNRNWNNSFYSEGAWISPVCDFGAIDTLYYDLTTIANIPSDADLDLYARASADGEDWGIGYFAVPLNHSFNGAPGFQYTQIMLNFTAASDLVETPELILIELDYAMTLLNEIPQLGDIVVTFDNETLEATIACLITDPDNDTLTVTLCLPLGDIEQTAEDVVNGTTVEFIILCTADTYYQFYLNATDSENATQSSLFGFTTGPPISGVHYATIYDYVAVGITFGLGLAFVSILSIKKFK